MHGETLRIGVQVSTHGRVMLWRPLEDGVTVVGANPEADISIPSGQVAPVHVLLRREGSHVTLLNRTPEGIKVGDELVRDAWRLADGDSFDVGPVTLTVRFEEAVKPQARTQTLSLDAAAPLDQTYFLSAPDTFPGKVFELGAAGLTLGVDASNDVVLSDPYVSSFHARLSLEDGRVVVRDLGSRNGVFVGERKVLAGEVPVGAQLRLGRVVFVLRQKAEAPAASSNLRGLVGSSAAMQRLREQIRRVAATDAPVLITGETGTGKEVVARMLTALSPRHARPFVALNCGALGKSLIESELFGHEKGAFTGAVARKAGAFEAADQGTLFLDELGELPLELQPAFLRVLETGEVRRVGAVDTFHVNVRLVAATHRRLAESVRAGTFREDLFHRLHVLVIELPPLRERAEDIPELARHFLDDIAAGGEVVTLLPDAYAKLIGHSWPGNVRELRNVIQRAVLMRSSHQLTADDITFTPSTLTTRVQTAQAVSQKTLSELEREAIITELLRFRGSKTEAAQALGVSRSTIHRKIVEYAIDVDALVDTATR